MDNEGQNATMNGRERIDILERVWGYTNCLELLMKECMQNKGFWSKCQRETIKNKREVERGHFEIN